MNVEIQEMGNPQPSSCVKYTLYAYRFPNGKHYIGQTKKKLSERTAQHVWEAKNLETGCIKLSHAMRKFNYQFERFIIATTNSLDDINSLEEEHIAKYDSIANGYNIRSGGANVQHSQEIISKRAHSLRKNKEDKDLPMFTKRIKAGKLIKWRIDKHPLCNNAYFKERSDMLCFLFLLEMGLIDPIVSKKR